MTLPSRSPSTEHAPGRIVERPAPGSAERILGAVAYAAQRLLRARGPEPAIDEVLAELGAATGVSRVYVFEIADLGGEVLARQRWEWVAPGVVAQIDNPRLQAARLRAKGFGTWADLLLRGELISGHADEFPAEITALLESHDVRSVAIVPIELDDELWGFIGFDECVERRRWSQAELAALTAAGDVLAGALQQDAARRVLEATARAHAAAYERERQATERLRALDGMKDAFLEAVSHELRTPLTAVVGFAETLDRLRSATGTDEDAVLAGLLANAERLRQLLEDLLDLGHLTRGALLAERTDVDVAEVIADVLADVAPLLEDRDVTVDVRVTTASVDRDKLERIIGNLVRNAVRHTGAGVPVAVRAWRDHGALQLAVEDAGDGIPDEHKLTVFQPFRHGPNMTAHSPGTGVGLSVVARYAVVHDGTAWIEDRPGGGTVVRVLLGEDLRTDAG